MKSYLYQKTTLTTKKIVGTYSADASTITTADGEEKNLTEELADFDTQECEIIIKVKNNEDLSASE